MKPIDCECGEKQLLNSLFAIEYHGQHRFLETMRGVAQQASGSNEVVYRKMFSMSRKQTEDNEVIPSPREYSKYTYKSFNFDVSYECGEDKDGVDSTQQVQKDSEHAMQNETSPGIVGEVIQQRVSPFKKDSLSIYDAGESLLDNPALVVCQSIEQKDTQDRPVVELDDPQTLNFSLTKLFDLTPKAEPDEEMHRADNSGWESFVRDDQENFESNDVETDSHGKSAWVGDCLFPHEQLIDNTGKASRGTKKSRHIMQDLLEMEEDMNVFKHIETSDASRGEI